MGRDGPAPKGTARDRVPVVRSAGLLKKTPRFEEGCAGTRVLGRDGRGEGGGR
ncbi:MAG TPA: hypothetical protein PLI31_00690 [Methanoregulaceae archaeon]|nr:hypothetical protein [Methanoregulaceae archaeon]